MDMYSDSGNGIIYVAATNIVEFEELISRAQTQADQLNETIRELKWFRLKLQISTENVVPKPPMPNL